MQAYQKNKTQKSKQKNCKIDIQWSTWERNISKCVENKLHPPNLKPTTLALTIEN